MIEELLTIDWEQVRLRRALSGLLSMLLVVAFIGVIGDVVFSALFAVLFVTAAGGDGTFRERLPGMVRFTLTGSAIGGLAFWSAETGWAVALVLGVATYLGTLAAGGGPVATRAGLYLTLWALFALMIGSTDTDPWTVAVAFLVGGAISIGATGLRLRVSAEDEAGDTDEAGGLDASGEDRLVSRGQLTVAVSSPIGLFAVLRAVVVVIAVLLGYWWFESYPLWVAITVIVVVKPSAHQSASIAVQRTLGTAAGVAIAVAVAQVLPRSDVAVGLAFLASGFLMIAFSGANYALFAAFLTSMLVFGQRLVQADAFEAGWQRLGATAVGAAVSLLLMFAARARFGPKTQPRPEPASGSDQQQSC